MPLYLYLDRHSIVHCLHPVVKVLAMFFLFVTVFVLDHPLFLLPLTVGITMLILLSDSVANVRRLRLLFLFISVFTLLIWSLFYRQGSPLFSFGWLHPTSEGVLFGLGMAVKLSTFLATGVLFLSTTRVEEFAFALTSLGVPYRLGFAMTLAFRLVPLFLDAAFTVIQAQRCRGLDVHGGNAMERLRRYIPVLIPVFMGALRRAEQMAIALEVRGFGSGRRRTSYLRTPWRPGDTLALFVVGMLMLAYLFLWQQGCGQVGGTSG